MTRHWIVLDTDVGIDDALMIVAIAAEPDAEIVAIGSSHGNCSAAQAARNAIRALDVVGLDHVPVAVGLESPLPVPISAPHVHGSDGLGDAGIPEPSRSPSGESAVDQLIRLSRERLGELDLVIVGSLTNIAAAIERDPDVLARFRSVWILGSYSRRPGGPEMSSSDFNTLCNPDAAALVYASATQLNVVPIDTTFRVVSSDEHLARIRESTSSVARFVDRILQCYLDFYQERMGRRTIPVHDPTVAAVLLHPELIRTTVQRRMIVEPWLGSYRAVGLDPGDSRPDDIRAEMRLITDVDSDRLLDLLVDAITRSRAGFGHAG
jgi:inosine-uridine nucleoside N-ribohydrolase